MMSSSSIDREQPKSVEEHLKLILNEKALVDPNFSEVSPKDLPEWFDEKLFKKGQDFYRSNMLGTITGGLTGLMAVFLIPSIANVLIFTRKSSTPCAAFKRYFETLLHTLNLYSEDPKDPDSKFYKSINTIRWKHSSSSKQYGKKKEDEGIMQKDMVLTQFSFIGYVLACSKKLGLPDDSDGKNGFNHMWRVLGHLLGIPNRINLCRKDTEGTTYLCKKILDDVYGKYLDKPSKDFNDLTIAAMDGLKCVDPLVDLDAFLVFLYDLHNKVYEENISWSSKFNAEYRKINFQLMRTPFVGFFVRHFWNFYLKITTWLNERCPIVAWIKFGKSNTRINLYPSLT